MALYVTRPRRDEVRIGRGLPSDTIRSRSAGNPREVSYSVDDAEQNLWRTIRAKILRSRYFGEYHPSLIKQYHSLPSSITSYMLGVVS